MKFLTNLKTTFAYDFLIKKGLLILGFLIIFIYFLYKGLIVGTIITSLIASLLLFIKNLRKPFLIIVNLLIIIFLNYLINRIIYIKATPTDYYKVYKVESFEEYNRIYARSGFYKIYFNTSNKYHSGDVLYLKGELQEASKPHFFSTYNQEEALSFEGIQGKMSVEEVDLIKHTFSIRCINEKISEYIDNRFSRNGKVFLKALTIGDKKAMATDLKEAISKVGIGHLFVISGLHMGIIQKALDKFLRLLKVKDNIAFIIILAVMLSYFIITFFLVSLYRVIMGMLLGKINTKFDLRFKSLDLISFNAISLLVVFPKYLFNYSFLLTYLIVFGIICIEQALKGRGILGFIKSNILISSCSILFCLPIQTSITPSINFLSIIFNLFYIPFVTYILLPASFITLIFPFVFKIYDFIINIFLKVLTFSNTLSFGTIYLARIDNFFIFIYYAIIILIFCFIRKKLFKFLSCLLLILSFSIIPYINLEKSITFFDLYNGEATLIRAEGLNILIDTGDVDSSLPDYLHYEGVRRIDYLFITHSDTDHLGGVNKIIKEFRVKQIFINEFDDLSLSYIEALSKKVKVNSLEKGSTLFKKNLNIAVLSPSKKYASANNNSLVMLITIKDLRILFCGDIEKEAEQNLIRQIGSIDYDILKVAHHGSATSSTQDFLNNFTPKVGIAMNGYANRFEFPSTTVVNRFKENNIPLYNTIDYGSIKIYQNIFSNKWKIKTSFFNP